MILKLKIHTLTCYIYNVKSRGFVLAEVLENDSVALRGQIRWDFNGATSSTSITIGRQMLRKYTVSLSESGVEQNNPLFGR